MCQFEGLDESYDAVFLVGYHQGDGDGVINHTLMAAAIRSVCVSGQVVDEAQLNAHVAGAFGVPVALVTGGNLVCDTAAAAVPGVRTVAVKRAIDRLSAGHEPIERTRDRIREQAAAAVRALRTRQSRPAQLRTPVRVLAFRTLTERLDLDNVEIGMHSVSWDAASHPSGSARSAAASAKGDTRRGSRRALATFTSSPPAFREMN